MCVYIREHVRGRKRKRPIDSMSEWASSTDRTFLEFYFFHIAYRDRKIHTYADTDTDTYGLIRTYIQKDMHACTYTYIDMKNEVIHIERHTYR